MIDVHFISIGCIIYLICFLILSKFGLISVYLIRLCPTGVQLCLLSPLVDRKTVFANIILSLIPFLSILNAILKCALNFRHFCEFAHKGAKMEFNLL